MKNIAVIPNRKRDANLQGTRQVVSMIQQKGLTPVLDQSFAELIPNAQHVKSEQLTSVDMAVLIGGDGTMLSAAKLYLNTSIPVLGVNYGHVGFLTEIDSDMAGFSEILDGIYVSEFRPVLDTLYQGRHYSALNEAVISRGSSPKMLHIEVLINGQSLNAFRADGVIISTASGSTAYSMSAGGPILDPTVDAFVITPVCPHNLYLRSVVVPSNKRITIRVEQTDGAALAIDGDIDLKLCGNQEITLSKGGHIHFVRKDENSFCRKIRSKIFERDI